MCTYKNMSRSTLKSLKRWKNSSYHWLSYNCSNPQLEILRLSTMTEHREWISETHFSSSFLHEYYMIPRQFAETGIRRHVSMITLALSHIGARYDTILQSLDWTFFAKTERMHTDSLDILALMTLASSYVVIVNGWCSLKNIQCIDTTHIRSSPSIGSDYHRSRRWKFIVSCEWYVEQSSSSQDFDKMKYNWIRNRKNRLRRSYDLFLEPEFT